MQLMLTGFADGMAVPDRFNEAWLVMLHKTVEGMGASGDLVRAPEVLRPWLLKHTDSKAIAATLARAMKPIVATGAQPSQ